MLLLFTKHILINITIPFGYYDWLIMMVEFCYLESIRYFLPWFIPIYRFVLDSLYTYQIRFLKSL